MEVVPAPTGIAQPAKTSGMATAALILGLAGLLFGFLTAIPAIVFGILGIIQTNKDPNLKGKGMAIAGVVLGGVILVTSVLMFILIVTSWISIGGIY